MSHARPLLILVAVASAVGGVSCRDPNSARAREDFRAAISDDQVATARRWLQAGLDPNEEATADCATPLALAALRGNQIIVDLLVKHGAGIDAAAGPNGMTALGCVAATEDNGEMVTTLLELGAEPNVPDRDGRTPLMHAATFGFVDTVRALIDAKADVHARDAKGATAVDLAMAASQNEAVALLVKGGARLPAASAQAEQPPTSPGLLAIPTADGDITLGRTYEELKPLLDSGVWIDTSHPSPTRSVETRRINGAVYRLTFEREGKTGVFRLARIDPE